MGPASRPHLEARPGRRPHRHVNQSSPPAEDTAPAAQQHPVSLQPPPAARLKTAQAAGRRTRRRLARPSSSQVPEPSPGPISALLTTSTSASGLCTAQAVPPARDRAPRPQVRPGPHPRRRDPSAGIAQKPLAWTFPEGAARPWLELSTCACRGHLDPAPRSEVLPPRHDGPELSAPRSTAGTWLFPLAAPCV